jgi:para-nitrobenzyl esterase
MAKRATGPVQTQAGRVSGRYNDEGPAVAVFRGMPYARPPVGPLRWRPPQPAVGWEGTREAHQPGFRAMQTLADIQVFMDGLVDGQGWGALRSAAVKLLLRVAPAPPQSEDCLTLNVRTPALDSGARLPVMVWFHGGDHQDGCASDMFYESSELSRRGAVVVGVNYRLGLMGYFMHPALSRESEYGVSGNYGTLDQIAALSWVKHNIRAFGGDPDNVTIFGESAGGESVAHMLTSPLSRGLFHKAILQSPANLGQMTFLRLAFLNNPAGEASGRTFADHVLGAGHPAPLEALRRFPAQKLYHIARSNRALRLFYPAIDGHVLQKSPFEAFLDGDQARVPLLLGSNANEGSLLYPITHAPLREYVHAPWPYAQIVDMVYKEFDDDAEAVLELYPGLSKGAEADMMALYGDSLFGAPIHFYARKAAQAGQPVYRYAFVRTPPSARQTAGAYHAAEIPFVHGATVPLFEFSEGDVVLQRAMGDYWARFAASGDPNVSPNPKWPRFSPEDPRVMQLGTGADLRPAGIARERQYEILERRLLRQIGDMKDLLTKERAEADQ